MLVEQADVLPARAGPTGAGPGSPARSASPSGSSPRASAGWLACARGGNSASRPLPRLQPPAQLSARRLQVLPELAAGVEGVDAHVGAAGQRRQHRVISPGRCTTRRTRAGRGSAWPARPPRSPAPVPDRPAPTGGAAGGGRVPGHPSGRREQRQPQRPLPALGAGQRCGCSARRQPLAPGPQQLGPGGGVFVEQVGQLGGQLAAAAIDGVGAGARRRQVLAHRRQLGGRQERLVVQQRQQVALDLGRRRPGDRRAPPRAARSPSSRRRNDDLQVGGDAQRLGQPELHVGLDVAVGDHQAQRGVGPARAGARPRRFRRSRPAAPRCGSNSVR